MPELIYDKTKRFAVPTYINQDSGREEIQRLYKDMYDRVMNDRCSLGRAKIRQVNPCVMVQLFPLAHD